MSLSDIIPSARNTINKGTGLRTLGILTTIFLLLYDLLGVTIFTDNVRIGLDTFSLTEGIQADIK